MFSQVIRCCFFAFFLIFNLSLAQNLSETGSWSEPVPFGIVPVAVANLPDGRLITWSSQFRDTFRDAADGSTFTEIFDPNIGANGMALGEIVTQTNHDMFCPGINNLADGRILSAGGTTSQKTSIYDWRTENWIAVNDMNIPRGYQGNVTLSDGSVFTLGGSWGGGSYGNRDAEVWTESTGWNLMSGIKGSDLYSNNDLSKDPEGLYRVDNHAWLWVAPDGSLFHAGPGERMNWFNLDGDGSVSPAGFRGNDTYSMKGTTVMFDVGKILKVGGSESYSSLTPAKSNSFVIDINSGFGSIPSVTSTNNSLAFSRTMHNSTVLPDGTVLVTGGLDHAEVFTDNGARLTSELYTPSTNSWTTVAGMAVPRTYHSVAILMPNGKVFVGGGGLCTFFSDDCQNHFNAEIYSPPYLFNQDNSLAQRPTISAPEKANYNSLVEVTGTSGIQEFSLIRLSSATHSTNNEQRRISIPFTLSNSTYSLFIPNQNLLPPGYYMLFAMNANGTPSVAEIVQIGSNLVSNSLPEDLIISMDFEENSGTLVSDATLYNNDFTVRERTDEGEYTFANDHTWGNDGVFGNALELDGKYHSSNSILELPYNQNIAQIQTGITVMAWVYRNESSIVEQTGKPANVAIFAHNYPSMFTGFHNSLLKWSFATSGGFTDCYGGYAPLNQWVHLAVTYDGQTARLYSNGVEICNSPLSGNMLLRNDSNVRSNFTISGFYEHRTNLPVVPYGNRSGITDELDGKIDEFKLFRRPLSNSEIKQYYNQGLATGNQEIANCNEGLIVPEYKINDGEWIQGNRISAPLGTRVYIRARNYSGEYFITTPQYDGPTFSSTNDTNRLTPEGAYQIDTFVQRFDYYRWGNPDRGNGLVDDSNVGQFVLTTTQGCPTVIDFKIGELYENNNPPVAIISANPLSGDTPLNVNFNSNNSYDDDEIVSYLWDFGDGSFSSLANPQHTYTLIGNYTVSLTVTDSDGSIDVSTININVNSGGIGNDLCPDGLVNENISLQFSLGSFGGGIDRVSGTDVETNNSPCAIEVVNTDSGQPWGHYRISIVLSEHGISVGDELFIGLDGRDGSGVARLEINRNNSPNTALGSYNFESSWTRYETTVTVPSGVTSLDLWMFSNYASSAPGTAFYDNLTVTNLSAGPPCDGSDYSLFFADVDADGYGDPNSSVEACSAPTGYVLDNTDCNDSEALSYPGNVEVCDGIDNDCDGEIDEDFVQTTYYADTDADGYGDPNDSIEACSVPTGYVLDNTDCNDSEALSYPGNVEVCDGVDNDCDGEIDEGLDCFLECPDGLVNENISLQFSLGSFGGGIDRVSGTDVETNNSPCAIEVVNTDSGQPWGHYRISIVLSEHGISVGDELFIGLDGRDGSGVARLEINRNNSPNTALGSYNFESSWTRYETTVTVPSGVTSLDLWMFSNYASSAPGTAFYDNLTVTNLSAGPPCDGSDYSLFFADVDADGYGDLNSSVEACSAPTGYVLDNTDCNDSEALSYPGNVEVCDGIDNDCDGEIDEDFVQTTYYADTDADGYGDPNDSIEACSAPTGYVLDNTDCNDSEALSYPGNVEVCDGIDNDCDGEIDEDFVQTTYYADTDADGYGDPNDSIEACSVPTGYVLDNTDCNDSEALSYPGNVEVCDGVDNDCDGEIDEGLDCFLECPDGLVNENISLQFSLGSFGGGIDRVSGTDVETNNSPCAIEVVNTDSGQPWGHYRISIVLSEHGISVGDELFIGLDGRDGSGVARLEINRNNSPNTALGSYNFESSWTRYETTVTVPSGVTSLDLWMFSNYASSAPGTAFYDNLTVTNLSAGPPCDGSDYSLFFADVDADGYGDLNSSVEACSAPTGYVLDNTDCNDSEALSYPGNVEVCDGIDNDCDGEIDEDFVQTTYYADTDADGYGDPNSSVEACSAPTGYVLDNTDCNDSEALSYPGNVEVCDGIDNDCDGEIDEDFVQTTYYADTDADGYGDPNDSIEACSVPTGYVLDNTDCNDSEALSYPGNVEVCDGVDNDCDGEIDEGLDCFLECPDGLVNENISLQFSLGSFGGGIDRVSGTDVETNNSPCAIEVVNTDSGQPWGHYRISIVLSEHGISVGDELFIGLDGRDGSGVARLEINRNNSPNTALGSYNFESSWTRYETTVTVPSGVTSLDLWMFSNYASSAPGTAFYDNLTVTNLSAVSQSAKTISFDIDESEELIQESAIFNLLTMTLTPNPASEIVTINFSEDFIVEQVDIFDSSGKLIESRLAVDKNQIALNVSEYNSGSYFIIASSITGKILQRQLMVQ